MGHALDNIVNDPHLLSRIRVQLKESTFLSQLFDNMSFEMARMRLDIFKIYANTEMISWLKNLSTPCLLMTGENDGGCSPEHNKKMANEIKNSELVILPKYKHSFLIEAPDEVANNLIKFTKKF